MSEVALSYPATLEFNSPEKIARWRPFVHWLLVIPHIFVLYVLSLVSGICVFIAWFAGVITGKIPEGLQGVQAMTLRYNTRVTTYMLFLREEYPPFDFDASLVDDGKDPRVKVDFAPEFEGRNRLTIFFRLLLAIPQFFALAIVGIAIYFVVIIGWFAVIILGHWPVGLRDFLIGYFRWSNRVNAYVYLLTDKYPPFSLQ